jgi:broad specificity phosphatase PhoE
LNLYFVRHGESEANILHVISNRGSMHGLTEVGREQVEALAAALEGVRFGRLYTSPLLRAVQTAEILSVALGVDYHTTDALRECDCGVIEGTGGQHAWRVYRDVLDAWFRRKLWNCRIEGGESWNDMRSRFIPFLAELVEESRAAAATEHMALVGHGGIFRCMLPVVLGNVDFEFALAHSLGYASYVLAEVRSEGPCCLDWDGARPL